MHSKIMHYRSHNAVTLLLDIKNLLKLQDNNKQFYRSSHSIDKIYFKN